MNLLHIPTPALRSLRPVLESWGFQVHADQPGVCCPGETYSHRAVHAAGPPGPRAIYIRQLDWRDDPERTLCLLDAGDPFLRRLVGDKGRLLRISCALQVTLDSAQALGWGLLDLSINRDEATTITLVAAHTNPDKGEGNMERVIVRISPQGVVSAEVEGVVGPSCKVLTDLLASRLGGPILSSEEKPEYNEQENTIAQSAGGYAAPGTK